MERNGHIRVAFVIWTLRGMGGSEKVVYDVARKLDKDRYKVFVVSLQDGEARDAYEKCGVTVRIAGGPRRPALLQALRRVLVEERIDLVNPHHLSPLTQTFLATLGLRVRCLYTEHSRWQMEQLSPLKKRASSFMINHVDGVVALSSQIRDYYLNQMALPPEKVHFLTNGIDLAIYAPGEGAQLKVALGIGREERVIGNVAHVRPEKNQKLLISALSELLSLGIKARLVLVGRDLMQGEVHRFAGEKGVLDRVLFLGERNDIARLIRAFDVFCLPSRYEGMPLTLLEAMASGVPVAGSNVLGINEVIRDGENGILFPDNDARSLALSLMRLLRDDRLRERLAASARLEVERLYSLDAKVLEYDRLFQSLVWGINGKRKTDLDQPRSD